MRQKGNWGWLKHDITHRGVTAWAVFLAMAAFYFFLYFPDKLGEFGRAKLAELVEADPQQA